MADSIDGVIKYAKTDAKRKAIQDVADLYTRKINGDKIDINEWLAARKAAAAYAASRFKSYSRMADKLISILKETK